MNKATDGTPDLTESYSRGGTNTEELSPDHELVLRIIAIAECLGIEGGISKLQITECFTILKPLIDEQTRLARIAELEKFYTDFLQYGHMNGDWEWELKQRLAALERGQ